jgi:hypothetical protein
LESVHCKDLGCGGEIALVISYSFPLTQVKSCAIVDPISERGLHLPIKRLAILLGTGALLWAQDYRARIQGIVTDSSDAAIAGAVVTIHNTNTGITTSRTTGQNGAYLADNVEPGVYTVSTEVPGFARQQRETSSCRRAPT